MSHCSSLVSSFDSLIESPERPDWNPRSRQRTPFSWRHSHVDIVTHSTNTNTKAAKTRRMEYPVDPEHVDERGNKRVGRYK